MINKLVLGTAQLGMKYGIANKTGQPSLGQCYKIIETAWQHKIRYFDTAQNYGDSELILGQCLKQLKVNNQAEIISKIPEDISQIDGRKILKNLKKSLFNLNVSSLYGLLLHNPHNLDSWNNNSQQVIKMIKESRLVQKIGISVYTYKEVFKALKNKNLEILQMPFNLFDQAYYHKQVFKKVKKNKVTIFLRSIFLQGILLMDIKELPKEYCHFIKYLLRRDKLCRQYGISKKELAISYIKKRAQGAFVIFGAEDPRQIEENISIFNKRKLQNDIIQTIEEKLLVTDENIINPSKWNKEQES